MVQGAQDVWGISQAALGGQQNLPAYGRAHQRRAAHGPLLGSLNRRFILACSVKVSRNGGRMTDHQPIFTQPLPRTTLRRVGLIFRPYWRQALLIILTIIAT